LARIKNKKFPFFWGNGLDLFFFFVYSNGEEVRMKKAIYVVAILPIFVLLVGFTSGCKKIEIDEFTWELVEGSGSYLSQSNTSSLKLTGILTIVQPRIAYEPLKANILDWRYYLLEGEAPVVAIHPFNFASLFGDTIPSISGWQENSLWIQIQVEAIDGDIFNGSTPDVMEISLAIEDEKGNLYNMTARAPFEFTRN
jgi:hypothetical protein